MIDPIQLLLVVLVLVAVVVWVEVLEMLLRSTRTSRVADPLVLVLRNPLRGAQVRASVMLVLVLMLKKREVMDGLWAILTRRWSG